MDKIVYNIKLDLLNEGIQGSLKGLRMGEHDARQIRISLRQSLKAVNLDGTETAIMFVRKTGVENPSLQACTIEGNEIVYDINASDVDTEGEVLFTLKIQLNGAITFTPHFCGYVMNPDVSDAEVPSQVEYTALEALINEVDGIKDDWEDALEELQEIIEHGGGTNVVANPTLDGTEPTLNGIQIGDGKYRIPEGGSGGVSDYNDLLNIPSINGVVVSGNKGLSDYGIEPKTVICESEEDYDSMLHNPTTRYLVPFDESEVAKKVIANPVLAGTEESLTGLQIGEEKYKIPQGGGGGGFSPTVVVTDIEGGHRVTITDELGPHVFDVMDGADGQNGTNGTNGADGADGTDGNGVYTYLLNGVQYVEFVNVPDNPPGGGGEEGGGEEGGDSETPTLVGSVEGKRLHSGAYATKAGSTVYVFSIMGGKTYGISYDTAGTSDYGYGSTSDGTGITIIEEGKYGKDLTAAVPSGNTYLYVASYDSIQPTITVVG